GVRRMPAAASRAATARPCNHPNKLRLLLSAASARRAEHFLLAEPDQRVLERRRPRPPAVAELARRLRAREIHSLAGHANGFDRDPRATASEPGERLGGVSQGQQRGVRHTDARWRTARQATDLHQDLEQGHVLAAEDVPLPDSSALESA